MSWGKICLDATILLCLYGQKSFCDPPTNLKHYLPQSEVCWLGLGRVSCYSAFSQWVSRSGVVVHSFSKSFSHYLAFHKTVTDSTGICFSVACRSQVCRVLNTWCDMGTFKTCVNRKTFQKFLWMPTSLGALKNSHEIFFGCEDIP